MTNLNTYLTNLSYEYFISYNSYERNNIINSLDTIKLRVKSYFGSNVKDVKIFGSWDRDTTLPRKYNSKSDVDIMIIFNHEHLNRTPETYRNWVKDFVELKYSRSQIQKDFPTVRLDMSHITFDLIPTKIETLLFTESYFIPDSGNQWMSTNPFSFTKSVIDANTNNNSIVKPLLRLIKAWNANNSHPFESFYLEKKVMNSVFFWLKDVESGFYSAANCLSTWGGTNIQNQKVTALQNAISNIQNYLAQNNIDMAKHWLHRLLPY